jgi:hypothetical protein
MKRIRISTLMLLIVIAALVVGLVVEKRRSAALLAEMQDERAIARLQAVEAAYVAQLAQARALKLEADAKTAASSAKPTASPSP